MKLPFGLSVVRTKTLSPIDNRGGWYPLLHEPVTGAWQTNLEVSQSTVLSYHAVYACMTLIASDIAKLRVKLTRRSADGIWVEIPDPASPIFTKPNRFQNRIQFWENWMLSKLSRGNVYVLMERDGQGRVVALYVLDPNRVTPMVADDGSVFYQLQTDNISGVRNAVMVPASEIIHDRMNCLFHPLVGISPIYANGLAATQGLNIQNESARFFGNRSMPSGILTAPGAIHDDTATRLKTHWETNYGGLNVGKVAVLGDGLKFEPLAFKPVDAQLLEQLKWTAEIVCSTFHVPPYMIGIGQMPTYTNIQALNQQYYSQALQILIESAEVCLDDGLGLGVGLGTEFDLDDLLRMDTATQFDVAQKAKGILTLDEQRRRIGSGRVEGGDTIYLQQQDHSLAAIAARDKLLIEQADQAMAGQDDVDDEDAPEVARVYLAAELKRLSELNAA